MGLVYKTLDLQFYPNLSLFPFAQVSHFHSFILYYLTIFLITFSLSNITSYYRFLIYIYTYIFFLCSLSFFLICYNYISFLVCFTFNLSNYSSTSHLFFSSLLSLSWSLCLFSYNQLFQSPEFVLWQIAIPSFSFQYLFPNFRTSPLSLVVDFRLFSLHSDTLLVLTF